MYTDKQLRRIESSTSSMVVLYAGAPLCVCQHALVHLVSLLCAMWHMQEPECIANAGSVQHTSQSGSAT